MSELPVFDRQHEPGSRRASTNQGRRVAVHSLRVLLFVSILMLIHFVHRETIIVESNLESNDAAHSFVRTTLPGAISIRPFDGSLTGNLVVGAENQKLGYVLQTSPQSDNVIGYSGPTNCLIALDLDNKIRSIAILASGDTVEHVETVERDASFFDSFRGLGFDSSDDWRQIDAVSGATLTSYAIIASVANRMGGSAPSLKFDATPKLENVAKLFDAAGSVESTDRRNIWNVLDSNDSKIGFVLSTTPFADHLSGYQGPTVTLAGFDAEQKCIGLVVDQTYDNEPYASYLNDDYGFLDFYQGKSLEDLAKMDPESQGIEGVSGATMTSMSVAEALPLAASAAIKPIEKIAQTNTLARSWSSYWGDLVTIGLTLIGVAFSFTTLRHRKWFRVIYLVAVILLLGFINGHMLSQASVAGWSTHTIPWRVAPGLVFLSLAAVAVPVVSKHQPYCQHVCPFGAMQQLGRNRLGWRLSIPNRFSRLLALIPVLLLFLVVGVAVSQSTFNLASIEPFDGFSFRVAGWATISVLVVGLLFSLVSPMAYCRYGCPTGTMLNFLKFRADSHLIGSRDHVAIVLLVFALVVMFF